MQLYLAIIPFTLFMRASRRSFKHFLIFTGLLKISLRSKRVSV